MANEVRISLKKERDAYVVDDKIVISDDIAIGYQVYVNTDEVSCWVGSCMDIDALEEIISEDNLIDTLNETASERELDIIMPVLRYNDYKYNFFGKIRTANIYSYCTEDKEDI